MAVYADISPGLFVAAVLRLKSHPIDVMIVKYYNFLKV
jgi:hypothetical protein